MGVRENEGEGWGEGEGWRCSARFVIREVEPITEDLDTLLLIVAQPLRKRAGRETVDHELAQVARIVIGQDLRSGHALVVEGVVQEKVHLRGWSGSGLGLGLGSGRG